MMIGARTGRKRPNTEHRYTVFQGRMEDRNQSIGIGVYSVPEAARLSRVSSQRVRRWVRGYEFVAPKKGRRRSPPVWQPEFGSAGDRVELSFRDMIEVRFVAYFLDQGVGWRTLREAATNAAQIIGDTHPFSTSKFKTDGRRIFLEYAERKREKKLLELANRQYNIPTVVEPYLYEGLEFDGPVVRWFPVRSRRIVIDPAIAFGQPTTSLEGVPTSILAQAVKAEGSIASAADWYQVDPKTVQEAVEFEKHLAA